MKAPVFNVYPSYALVEAFGVSILTPKSSIEPLHHAFDSNEYIHILYNLVAILLVI